MKKFFVMVVFNLVLLSCNNSTRTNAVLKDSSNSESFTDSQIDSNLTDDIPVGYNIQPVQQYIPKNNIELNLMSYLYEYSSAMVSRNAKKIADLQYPDYYILLQKELPDKSIIELKEKVQLYYEENLDNIIEEYTKDWSKAKFARPYVTNIVNRVKEGNKLLYLYEYHTILYNETDTIYKDEAEYSVIVSLNNGNTWYATSNNIDEIFELLSMRFNRNSIEEVLTKH